MVLFPSWDRLMQTCKSLLKDGLRFGGIFPTDPFEPVGSFMAAPECANPIYGTLECTLIW